MFLQGSCHDGPAVSSLRLKRLSSVCAPLQLIFRHEQQQANPYYMPYYMPYYIPYYMQYYMQYYSTFSSNHKNVNPVWSTC